MHQKTRTSPFSHLATDAQTLRLYFDRRMKKINERIVLITSSRKLLGFESFDDLGGTGHVDCVESNICVWDREKACLLNHWPRYASCLLYEFSSAKITFRIRKSLFVLRAEQAPKWLKLDVCLYFHVIKWIHDSGVNIFVRQIYSLPIFHFNFENCKNTASILKYEEKKPWKIFGIFFCHCLEIFPAKNEIWWNLANA